MGSPFPKSYIKTSDSPDEAADRIWLPPGQRVKHLRLRLLWLEIQKGEWQKFTFVLPKKRYLANKSHEVKRTIGLESRRLGFQCMLPHLLVRQDSVRRWCIFLTLLSSLPSLSKQKPLLFPCLQDFTRTGSRSYTKSVHPPIFCKSSWSKRGVSHKFWNAYVLPVHLTNRLACLITWRFPVKRCWAQRGSTSTSLIVRRIYERSDETHWQKSNFFIQKKQNKTRTVEHWRWPLSWRRLGMTECQTLPPSLPELGHGSHETGD